MQNDWLRNLGSCLTEKLAIKPSWNVSLVDIRLGFKRNGKWSCLFQMMNPVEQNYWNGVFTFQLYLVGGRFFGIPVVLPHVGVVSRYARTRWFEAGFGWLFDRGELNIKFTFMEQEAEAKWNPGVDAKGWDEGSV